MAKAKRKYPVAIPDEYQEWQQDKMIPREKLQAFHGVVSAETKTTNGDCAYGSTITEECQEQEGGTEKVFKEMVKGVLKKEYEPRRELVAELADVMSDMQSGDQAVSTPDGEILVDSSPDTVNDFPVVLPRRFFVRSSYKAVNPVRDSDGNFYNCYFARVPVDGGFDMRYSSKEGENLALDTEGGWRLPADVLRRKAETVAACGTWLRFGVAVDGVKLREANFCKHRLCPLCNWRRGLKVYGTLTQILGFLAPRGYRYIALTLTLKNCAGEALAATIDRMVQAWRNMVHDDTVLGVNFWRKWRGKEPVVQGAFRSLEVTVNEKEGTYHPHFHVLLAVDSVYYSRSKSLYVNHDKWVQVWRNALGLDYDPRVMVQAADRSFSLLYDLSKGDMGKVVDDSAASGALAPGGAGNQPDDALQKYISKSGEEYAIKLDFLTDSDDFQLKRRRVLDLFTALYRRRLVSFSGCFREARKELGLTDPETGPLDDGPADDDLISFVASWRYCGGYQVMRWKS